jgi:hypothetical protein
LTDGINKGFFHNDPLSPVGVIMTEKTDSLCRIRDSCTGCFDEIEIRLAGMTALAQTGRRFFDFFNLHDKSPLFRKEFKKNSAVNSQPEYVRVHHGFDCLSNIIHRVCQFS